MHYHCCVPVREGMFVSPNIVFSYSSAVNASSLLCHWKIYQFLFCKGKRTLGVYTETLLSLLYSVFLLVLHLRSFFSFQFSCSSQSHIHGSHFLFKFSFKHLTGKVLIIFYFKV